MLDQAVILCGGRGTRLGTVAAAVPKPLISVGAGPFLDKLLFELGRHGVRRVLLLAGFAGSQVVEYANATPLKARFPPLTVAVVEPEPAATGGAVSLGPCMADCVLRSLM